MKSQNVVKILIVEDDYLLGNSLKEFLELEGFNVRWITSGSEIEYSTLMDTDLIVLDLILPDLPGEKLLSNIKSYLSNIPIIVLTAKDTIETKKECFEKGVDDYVTKPFSPAELLLRIKAVLRRAKVTQVTHRHEIGKVIIDLEKQVIRRGNEELTLSKRAWDLLVTLLKNRGTVVSKEKIMKEVWYDAVVSDESVRSYIKELRKILPEGAITTLRGRGYRLN